MKKTINWLKTNLFYSPFSSVLTLVFAYFAIKAILFFLDWGIINATWVANQGSDCERLGACWGFIGSNLENIFFGFYERTELYRPIITFILFIALMIPLFLKKFKYKLYLGGFVLFVFPFIAFTILEGSNVGLKILAKIVILASIPSILFLSNARNLNNIIKTTIFIVSLVVSFWLIFPMIDSIEGNVFDKVVQTNKWGGFMLTLILASIGIVASLPIGIALALGRRSELVIVKNVCIVFIEFWRGVPLITVLFMSSVMLPLFMPEGSDFDKLARALIGITLFQSAYMAEVVRGGLQAIPRGQYEAADSLGLSYWKKNFFIILPQALKLVIPGIVNTFIALFKDTSLVSIIGLLDLKQMPLAANSATLWTNYDAHTEALLFAALIYWICCFSMSKYSQSVEKKLETGHKR